MEQDEILEKYPEMVTHHPYCLELFFLSRKNKCSWSCRCVTLKDYDVFLLKNKRVRKGEGDGKAN